MASTNPQESLQRAQFGQSMANYATIINGFIAKGIPADEIKPRENVFTFNAWQAKGRRVKRGEHGVRCFTFIEQTDRQTGERKRRPWSTTVFHVSQTEPTSAPITPAPRRIQNTYETMSDEALAAIAATGRGKALLQLTEAECMAMMEQMRRAQATVTPAELPALLANVAEEAKTIDVTPTAAVIADRAEAAAIPAYDVQAYNEQLRRDHREKVEAARAARTPRERVLAGEPVSILDLMPDKIDARPRGPQVILNGQPLKPQLKKRRLAF